MTRSLGLVSTLVLARLLVPADFGLVAMATTFSAGVEALSQLGLQDALVRRREDGFELHHTAFTL
ncbi:MAG TPA: oligosaccharide flippase family protein, partial [Acetobacteraceae bacterium]